jgi:biotin carboxylase
MKDCLALIESNTSGTGRHFVSTARRLGLEPIVFAENPSRYPYLREDSVYVIQQPCFGRTADLARQLDRLAKEFRIAGIYSSSEYFIETAAELARDRKLSGPDPGAVWLCRNKARQRQCLRKARIGQPASACAGTIEEALKALHTISLPVVIKPVMGTGSVGVRLCRTRPEVETHAGALLALKTNERGMPVPHEILIEEYVRWPEFSAEIFAAKVIGITRKHVSREPYFVETGHDFPAELPPDTASLVMNSLLRCIEAVGLSWGPVHVEFRCDQDNFAIMEINPRLAGGFIPEAVRAATGIDLIEQTIALATGRRMDLTPKKRLHASIRFLCPRAEGILKSVHGVPEALALQGVTDVQIYKKTGDSFAVHNDFRDRIGHVTACSDSERSAAHLAETARDLIRIEL